MPRGVPGSYAVPCESCEFREQCARSAWTCKAFNRFVNRNTWTPEQRRPSVAATRAALNERARACEKEQREERRARKRASNRAWRARNPERAREMQREGLRRWYRRMCADPKRHAAFLERTARWRAQNADRVRDGLKARYERVKADPAQHAALKKRRADYRAANRERVRERSARWRQKNRDAINAKARAKLAALKPAEKVPAAAANEVAQQPAQPAGAPPG
jgi:hypothetical protein